jgi:hypothetical protein
MHAGIVGKRLLQSIAFNNMGRTAIRDDEDMAVSIDM